MFDYDSVEFNTYIDFIKGNIKSPFARELLGELDVSNSLEFIIKRQKLLREAIYYGKNSKISLFDDDLIFSIYTKIKNSSFYLSNIDFVRIMLFLKYVKSLKQAFKEKNESTDLSKIIASIDSLDDFSSYLERIFDENGNIKDSANDNIQKIRKEMHRLRRDINSALNKVIYGESSKYFINENVITERYNRYLILCKPNFRNYIEGLVQDVSISGQTYYVEPLQIVELNNAYRECKIDEEEEIRRIIEELNCYVRENKDILLSTLNLYKQFIYYVELGRFYSLLPVCFPVFTNRIVLKNIHHPLIFFNKKAESVPIDFSMDENIYLSVITGPNAGGKTAAIKLVGLNSLIAKSGLPLFGEYGEMINFEGLLCAIGDKQSIMMDLSSFSAHIFSLKEILKHSTKNTLVIMDEPGSNTEPRKGAALSLSIIRELVERGCKVLVASHYEEIKNEGLINRKGKVYAVDYDYDSNKPMYKLIEGISGDSSPFIIAKKYGLPDHVLERAEKIYNEMYSARDKTLDEIREMQINLQKKLYYVEDLLKSFERLFNYLNEKWENFDKYLKEKEEKILMEAQYYLNKAKNIYKKSKKINKNEVDSLSQQVETKIDELKESHEYIKNVKVGDKIFLSKIGKIADIIELSQDEAIINLDNKRINLDRRDLLGKIVKEEKKEVKIIKGEFKKYIPEINIIGKRVDEACELLDGFIDKMVLDGINKFYIIHGRGTGALRKGVHDYLRTCRYIKSFRLASIDEGGDAITVVEI
jgi:DNA mismatch repair protein MutS2